jgi:hypothetical protein
VATQEAPVSESSCSSTQWQSTGLQWQVLKYNRTQESAKKVVWASVVDEVTRSNECSAVGAWVVCKVGS